MTRPVKVLVADDAVVIRRLLSDVLDEDPGVEVVGVAANGRLALQKLEQLDPDVVILDIEMPVLDGLGTLRELRKLRPKLPVIMFSTLTERGATATFEALTLGASDYVTKPSNTGSVHESMQRVREELIPKIKALAARAGTAPDSATRLSTLGRAMAVGPDTRPGAGSAAGLAAARPTGAPSPAVARTSPVPASPGSPLAGALPTGPTTASSRIDAVVIGVSTGGPVALGTVIPGLRGDLPVPVLVVQHMPALFTRILAERIDAQAALRVFEAEAGEPVVPGRGTSRRATATCSSRAASPSSCSTTDRP
ncbi:MAG: response regulator [Acidimicrobiia bacterium]